MHRIVSPMALVLFAAAAWFGQAAIVGAGGGGGHGCPIPPRDGTGEPVVIKHSCFAPAVIYVEPGGTVEWRAEDNHVPHNVMMFDGDLVEDERNLSHGSSVSMTFEQPGVYGYYCEVHPGMTGVVVVQEPDEGGFVIRTTPERLEAIETVSKGISAPMPVVPFLTPEARSQPEQSPAEAPVSEGVQEAEAGAGRSSLTALGVAAIVVLGCVAGAAIWRRKERVTP